MLFKTKNNDFLLFIFEMDKDTTQDILVGFGLG